MDSKFRDDSSLPGLDDSEVKDINKLFGDVLGDFCMYDLRWFGSLANFLATSSLLSIRRIP